MLSYLYIFYYLCSRKSLGKVEHTGKKSLGKVERTDKKSLEKVETKQITISFLTYYAKEENRRNPIGLETRT